MYDSIHRGDISALEKGMSLRPKYIYLNIDKLDFHVEQIYLIRREMAR